MHIILVEIDLHIPSSQSLKDKRAVLRSIKDKLRTRHNISIAEVDHHDKWQLTTLAIVTVSNIGKRAEENIRVCIETIETQFDVVVTGVNQQWL